MPLPEQPAVPEHVDVLIVGAGLSGIGAACHLQMRCPRKQYLILEGRSDIGGTWSLFKYPGVRSDSDMYTLGYGFKPWRGMKAIADGPSILEYLRETAREYQVDRHIRFNWHVARAEWSSQDARWSVTARNTHTGVVASFTCSFLLMCAGYFSYADGHTPPFPGRERFGGAIVHPQQWPESWDYTGKRIVVVGSGATAVTLVPALCEKAAHVTMLQRSPTWVMALPAVDRIAIALRSVLPGTWAYKVTRWKNTWLQQWMYARSRTKPDAVKRLLLRQAQRALGPGFDVETHFTPRYKPWDQRLCVIPDGDLFKMIRSGKASVVTDEIDTFTETGIALRSGGHLEADAIVTATGLHVVRFGGVDVVVDGRPVEFSQTWSYKGVAFADVPNLVSIFGYTNAAWTLRADLIAQYVCRLLNHLDATATTICVPRLRPEDRDMPARPWLEDFTPGYVLRAAHLLPKQGDREPWRNVQSYRLDKARFGSAPLEDGVMRFETARSAHAFTADANAPVT